MDLRELLKEKEGDPLFKERDYAYEVFDAYIMSRRSGKDKDRLPQLTYKPFSTARTAFVTPRDHKLAINLSRRIHSYFTSTFSRGPLLSKLPADVDEEAIAKADRTSFFLDAILGFSRAKAGQPRTASWLSNRGDGVMGADWDKGKGEIYVRSFDPMWCYPTLEPFDVGGCVDMLITFEMPREQAEAMYAVALKKSERRNARVFIFWTATERVVQVEEKVSEKYSFKHDLGRCPFRWIFGNNDGMFAQSDIRDVPSLQDFYNENLVLAMDTIRKQVDSSWVIFGHNKDLTPKPGQAVGVARPDAKLQRFEAGGDPAVIMQVMQMLESGVEASTGISPASSRGQVSGSTLTGAAVRNQVQAMEARNEARKAAFEDAYEQIGVLVLQVLERCMGAEGVKVRSRNGVYTMKPEDVDKDYLCEATYGGFIGMDLAQRIQASLAGLGRLYGLSTAIRLADIPGVNAASVEKEVNAYQKSLAVTAASAQSIAQQVAQQAQPSPQDMGQSAAPPGAQPQRQQPAPPPAVGQMGGASLGDIQRALEAIKSGLHGEVWAVGELAVAGMAARPIVMVESEKDLGRVQLIMQALHVFVMAGRPGDMPNLAVA